MISNTDVIMVFQHLASPVTQLCHSVSFRILHLIRYQIVFIKLYENKVAMEKGLRFAIREGGRTVGAGQVTEILD